MVVITHEYESKIEYFELRCANDNCHVVDVRIIDLGVYALPLDGYCPYCGWYSLKSKLIEGEFIIIEEEE